MRSSKSFHPSQNWQKVYRHRRALPGHSTPFAGTGDKKATWVLGRGRESETK